MILDPLESSQGAEGQTFLRYGRQLEVKKFSWSAQFRLQRLNDGLIVDKLASKDTTINNILLPPAVRVS